MCVRRRYLAQMSVSYAFLLQINSVPMLNTLVFILESLP